MDECDCAIEQLFKKSFVSLTYDQKQTIIEKGRPTPVLHDLTKKYKTTVRTFKFKYYNTIKWLSGCKKTNKLYCWPCLIFSREENVWTKYGFNDLNNFHNLVKRHESYKSHIQCLIDLTKFGKTRIDISLSEAFRQNAEEKHNTAVKNNRYIVSSLIDAICFLAQQELAFRGHDEKACSVNRGHYIELIHLMAQRDELLKIHLSSSTIFTGLSRDVQNDLIQSVSNILLRTIESEISQTSFVAMIIDETTDAVSKCQLSTVLRYVIDSEVVERFLGFTDVSNDRSARNLSEHVFRMISKYGCEKKLIAQTYDGAAVMAGEHNGLQSTVRSKYENALFVHCYAPKLNLVLQQSVEYIKECKIFFSTLSGLSSFFSKTTKRIHALDNGVKKLFPPVAPTWWNCNSRLIETMIDHRLDILNLMRSITENPQDWDSEILSSAKGYIYILQDFDFNFFLKIFSGILPQASVLFDILQKNILDISDCSQTIDHFRACLNTYRTNFDKIWLDLENGDFETPQYYRAKKQRIDRISIDKKANYRRLYFEIIDVIINKTNQRFSKLDQLLFFSLLDFKKFKLYVQDFPINAINSLKESYGAFFDFPKLKSELSIIYSSVEFQKENIHDLLMYLKATNLDEHLLQTTKLVSLMLTIPATRASAERSFSTLERIKTVLARNSQGQDRLASLSILSIEKKLLLKIKQKHTFHDEVIEDFLKKNRRIDLIYK